MNIKKMIKLKAVLLLCVVWVCVFAAPVQGQAPTALACVATALADDTDYVLGADCSATGTAITVAAGVTATVDGGGFTISGTTSVVITVSGAGAELTVSNLTISGVTADRAIDIQSGATLNLNNVTIIGSGTNIRAAVNVWEGTLNARNVIFRDNVAETSIRVGGSAGTPSTVNLNNMQFLNNAAPNRHAQGRQGSAITVWTPGGTVDFNGGVVTGNSGQAGVILVNEGTLTLRGCIRSSGNTDDSDGALPLVSEFAGAGDRTVNNRISCKKKKKDDPTPAPTATERPPTPATCMGLHAATGIVVNAAFGLNSGVQCQQLDGGGIGIQALAANYIAAVDIWGYVDQGVEVCFPGVGRIIYLDASTMPRAMSLLPTHGAENGITCASIESPGSLVLLPPE